MKWMRTSRNSQLEVATIQETGHYKDIIGIGGSYFRSLSEDPPPPPPPPRAPPVPKPPPVEESTAAARLDEGGREGATLVASSSLSTTNNNKLVVRETSLRISRLQKASSVGLDIKLQAEDPWIYSKRTKPKENAQVTAGHEVTRVADKQQGISTVEDNERNIDDDGWTQSETTKSCTSSSKEDNKHCDPITGEEIPEDPWSTRSSRKYSAMASTTSLISSQINTSSRSKIRCTWILNLGALIVAFSSAMSLGNVLRLPRLVLLHGAGPFLVAYIIILFVLGLPLVFLEIGLGQFCQQGSLQIYRAVPLLKGVGLVKLLMALLLCAYYPVFMATSLFSLVWSAKGPLPFTECSNLYPGRLDSNQGYSLASSEQKLIGEQCLKQSILKPPREDGMWLGVNYALLFVLWTFLLLSQWGGRRWYRRSIVISALIAVAALISVLVDVLIIKDTISWPLYWTDWSVLTEPTVWYFATVQVFFSTQIGFGINVTNAGKIFPKKNAFWVSLSLILLNLIAGLGAVWVAWLWLEKSTINHPSDLYSEIPEIVVISLILDFGSFGSPWLPQMWACFAFLLVIVAGFISTASLLYTLITAISSETFAEKWRKWLIVLVICIIGFVAGVLCFVPSYIEFAHLLDHYVVGRLVIATTILELIGFAWIYGCNTLYNDFEFVLGQKMNVTWKIIWVTAPIILLGIELWSIFSLPLDGLPQSPRNPDPDWVTITGWSMYLCMWLIVFGSALWTLGQQVDYNFSDKLRSAIKPSSKWGPADPLHRHGWVRWRTQYSTTGRKDFTLRRRGTRDYTHSARGSPATTLGRPNKKKNEPIAPQPVTAVGVVTTQMPWQSSPSP